MASAFFERQPPTVAALTNTAIKQFVADTLTVARGRALAGDDAEPSLKPEIRVLVNGVQSQCVLHCMEAGDDSTVRLLILKCAGPEPHTTVVLCAELDRRPHAAWQVHRHPLYFDDAYLEGFNALGKSAMLMLFGL